MKKTNFFSEDVLLYRKNGKYPNAFVRSNEDILRAITELEASDGAVVLSRKKSALFMDGRYALAAKQYVDSSKFEILNLRNSEIVKWIEENLPENSMIAFDPEYFSHEEADFFTNRLKDYQFSPIDLKKALNMPPEKFELEIYRLNDRENKLSHIAEIINQNDLDAYLICDPCSIAWLLNIRDLNQKYTLVVLCRVLITKNGEYFLYLDDRYGSSHEFKSENDLPKNLAKFSRIGIDKSQTPFSLKHSNFVDLKNPCANYLKSKEEIEDVKLVARKDSAAVVNFLHWFHTSVEKITELDATQKILHFRKQQEGFICESFKTIAAADENAAIVHYSPNCGSNRRIENILLVDSGGQYKNGTTDITRTVSIAEPTEEQKLFYTLVLKGHIALANAKFPTGTSGSRIDSLARQFLWGCSKDYAHSTGHGIGYMSHVHEGPIAISQNNGVPLQAGMILSNEPGYYQENGFGIRLENMVLTIEDGDGYLSFETISLVPFDRKFICNDMLTKGEMEWLDKYNRKILSSLELSNEVRDWLSNYIA